MNELNESVKIERCGAGWLVVMQADNTEKGVWAMDLFVETTAACCKKSSQFSRFANVQPLHRHLISMLFPRREEIPEFFEFMRSEVRRHDIQLTE
jgi:hypothetical protein